MNKELKRKKTTRKLKKKGEEEEGKKTRKRKTSDLEGAVEAEGKKALFKTSDLTPEELKQQRQSVQPQNKMEQLEQPGSSRQAESASSATLCANST